MNPWIKSGVCLLIRNAVRNGVYKRSGQTPDLREIPIEDIAVEALGPHLDELQKEIAWMIQKSFRLRFSSMGDERQTAHAVLLDSIAEAAEKLVLECKEEQQSSFWRMF